MRTTPAGFALEFAAHIAPGAIEVVVVAPILAPEALVRRPGLNKLTVNAEVLVTGQPSQVGPTNKEMEEPSCHVTSSNCSRLLEKVLRPHIGSSALNM